VFSKGVFADGVSEYGGYMKKKRAILLWNIVGEPDPVDRTSVRAVMNDVALTLKLW
jgi:hypothetical protein